MRGIDIDMGDNTPFSTGQEKAAFVRYEPLPEVVIPQAVLQERENGILHIIRNPPDVDCFHVLARSGTLAATGLYEDPEMAHVLGLPPMIPVSGVGREVYSEWRDVMYIDIYAKGSAPPESVYRLIERYGSNLFQFHGQLLSAFSRHTQEVLQKNRLLPESM